MSSAEGKSRDATLYGTLRDVYLQRRTGALEVVDAGADGRLYFIGGELYLAPDHPLAKPGAAGVEPAEEGSGEPPATPGGEALGRELAELLARYGDSPQCTFADGASQITSDLVGPLSTGSLLMDLSVQDRDEVQLLRRLGGEERCFVSVAEAATAEESPGLDPLEAFFISRLDRPASVKELLRQTDVDRESALRRLCRLRAVDLIVPEELAPVRERTELLSRDLLEKFSRRIAASLAADPLELDPEAHRQRLVDLLGRLGELTHFDLLGVGLGATSEEVHAAYIELGRVLHPSHALDLGLEGREGALQMLFEKATEAYLTLNDPDRSRQYQLKMGSSLSHVPSDTGSHQRQEEQQDLAAENYRSARTLAAKEDYFGAIQLLEQAVRVDPQPDYFALLGRCQAENPKWLDRALYNCSRAVELAPDDAALRTELGRLYEKSQNPSRAREEYEAALDRMPGFPEATEGLERLVGSTEPDSGGLLNRVLSRLRRGA